MDGKGETMKKFMDYIRAANKEWYKIKKTAVTHEEDLQVQNS